MCVRVKRMISNQHCWIVSTQLNPFSTTSRACFWEEVNFCPNLDSSRDLLIHSQMTSPLGCQALTVLNLRNYVLIYNNINPIWTGGGGAESAPLRFFLYNSKTPGDIEKKLSDFNFTPLMDILRILSITILVRCCYSNLLFPVCHVIFWVEKTKKLELFSR